LASLSDCSQAGAEDAGAEIVAAEVVDAAAGAALFLRFGLPGVAMIPLLEEIRADAVKMPPGDALVCDNPLSAVLVKN
jgi:hypothetical protein